MLYAIGRNINKYHRFLHDKIKKFEGKTEEKAAWKKSVFKNAVGGLLRPKIHIEEKNTNLLQKIRCEKTRFL